MIQYHQYEQRKECSEMSLSTNKRTNIGNQNLNTGMIRMKIKVLGIMESYTKMVAFKERHQRNELTIRESIYIYQGALRRSKIQPLNINKAAVDYEVIKRKKRVY